MATNNSWIALSLLALAACGGGDLEEGAAPEPVALRRRQLNDSAATVAIAEEQSLNREVYAYVGGGRDPFESLLDNYLLGPEIGDLTLVAVYIDHFVADRSIAVVRDKVSSKRYNLHEGERLGRIRVAAIRERDVDFIVDDFGTSRRETLSLRRLQEEQTP
ncbi:MAG TPA: hypothetical protein VFO95_08630 [Gemmatimonadales bacterium]|nr:hypothetical protein [Gemmatimonadales bacterium]